MSKQAPPPPLQWYLVSNFGFNFLLSQTMISLGRENCDVILESQSADGKHAVITYDHYEKRFKVKDLNTVHGTYVNENRIPVHTFVFLQHLDCLRFGYVIYQLQGIPRVYSGPSYNHYNSTSSNYYPVAHPVRPSSWTSPYISSPHVIINKMSDGRSCECKQDAGRFSQSSRDSPELSSLERQNSAEVIKGVPHSPSVRQDYCGNIVASNQGQPSHNPSVVDANLLKNGHSQTPTEFAPKSLPLFSLSKESCNCDADLNGGCNVKVAHRRSASLEPIASDRIDTGTFVYRKGKKSSDLGVCTEDKKSAEMVVMEAEKPYVQFETKMDDDIADDDHSNGSCRPVSTAFTVDFTDNRTPSLTSKKLDIKDSISKFAPPKPEADPRIGHRRHLSLPKITDCYSDENGNEELLKRSSPLEKDHGKDQSWDIGNTHGLGPSKIQLKETLGLVRGGYFSEGHMSSDQDDELSAKSDPTRKPTSSLEKEVTVSVNPVATPAKHQENKTTKKGSRRSLPVSGLRDSAKYLISRMFGEVTAPPSSPSDPPAIISPGGPVSKLTLNTSVANGVPSGLKKGDAKSGSRSSLTSTTTYTVDGREMGKPQVLPKTNLKETETPDLDVSEEDEEEEDDAGIEDEEAEEDDEAEQANDNGSETGTYTIEKDGDNAEEVKEARKNIDVVFGVTNKAAPKSKLENEEELRTSPEVEEKKIIASTPSKGNSSWLKEWAASSLDMKMSQSPLVISSALTENRSISTPNSTLWTTPSQGSVQPFASSFSTSSNSEVPQRPRRKLPVIPTDKISALSPSVHSVGMNHSKAGGEAIRSFSNSNRSSPDENKSDSTNMDTETILRETETVVSAMEARMDNQRLNQKEKCGVRDSGGESDVDTSTASATNEVELRPKKLILHKKIAAQLKSQLKSFEDDSTYDAARSLSPRTLRRSLMGSLSSHGRTTPTDSVSEVETASIHSDISSSSELSGSSPSSKRKHRDSAPLMRFNRAFSLRRARLGCESETSPQTPTAKPVQLLTQPPQTQVSRPNSASSAASSKGKQSNGNNNYCKSDSGSSSSAVAKKSTSRPPPVSANNSFNRSDGGRFSLRLPRSAGPPARPSSAKTVSTANTPVAPPRVKSAGSSGRSAPPSSRSNSTLSAKELELKNWKRRKEYDPLKAAAEGRKKDTVKKTANSSAVNISKSESPSPTATTFHRSASFHGTDALNGSTAHLRRNTFNLDDIENELSSPGYSGPPAGYRHTMSDADSENVSATYRGRGSRKSSEDELEATRTMTQTERDNEQVAVSPRESPLMHVHPAVRHKTKVDALDNLVISTIHQLSSHLRSNAELLLTKIRDSHGRNCDQALGAGFLNELLERLALEDSPGSSPQNRSVSKQLSGILKNLKRLEESLHAVDRVMDAIPSTVNSTHQRIVEGSSHKKWNGFKDQEYY